MTGLCGFSQWDSYIPTAEALGRDRAGSYSKALVPFYTNFSESVSCLVVSNSATPRTVAQLLCPWNSPGKNTGVGSHSLLQGIFLTQGLNPGLLCLLHCRWIVYHLSHWGSPNFNESLVYFPQCTINVDQETSQINSTLNKNCHNFSSSCIRNMPFSSKLSLFPWY